jgi:hypothetical protein
MQSLRSLPLPSVSSPRIGTTVSMPHVQLAARAAEHTANRADLDLIAVVLQHDPKIVVRLRMVHFAQEVQPVEFAHRPTDHNILVPAVSSQVNTCRTAQRKAPPPRGWGSGARHVTLCAGKMHPPQPQSCRGGSPVSLTNVRTAPAGCAEAVLLLTRLRPGLEGRDRKHGVDSWPADSFLQASARDGSAG